MTLTSLIILTIFDLDPRVRTACAVTRSSVQFSAFALSNFNSCAASRSHTSSVQHRFQNLYVCFESIRILKSSRSMTREKQIEWSHITVNITLSDKLAQPLRDSVFSGISLRNLSQEFFSQEPFSGVFLRNLDAAGWQYQQNAASLRGAGKAGSGPSRRRKEREMRRGREEFKDARWQGLGVGHVRSAGQAPGQAASRLVHCLERSLVTAASSLDGEQQ